MKRHKGRERRKGFRKALDFGVGIKRVNKVTFKRKWDHECGVNIGLDGFCLCSTEKLPDEAAITCKILFPPPFDETMLEAEAKLVWQRGKRGGADPLWYHGFRFTRLDPASRKLIEQVLEKDCD